MLWICHYAIVVVVVKQHVYKLLNPLSNWYIDNCKPEVQILLTRRKTGPRPRLFLSRKTKAKDQILTICSNLGTKYFLSMAQSFQTRSSSCDQNIHRYGYNQSKSISVQLLSLSVLVRSLRHRVRQCSQFLRISVTCSLFSLTVRHFHTDSWSQKKFWVYKLSWKHGQMLGNVVLR